MNTKIIDLLKKLKGIGAHLYLKSGNLKLDIEKGLLTDEISKEIQKYKSEIIQFLLDSEETYTAIKRVADKPNYPLSSAQNRLWILSQFPGNLQAYNMPTSVRLKGEYDLKIIKKAIVAVVERHEILRTIFKEDEKGKIKQWILPKEDIEITINYNDLTGKNNLETFIKEYIKKDNQKVFNLEKGPLLRVSILQTSKDEYVFYYNMHHIISDGWSKGVFIKDILYYYEKYKANTKSDLPALNIQYKDYSFWQLTKLKSEEGLQHKSYWLEKFSDELPVLDLPNQKIRPAVKTYNGQALEFYLSEENTDRILNFGQQNGGSLFITLLALWNVLLYYHTSERDITIGTSVAGRDHPDLEDQIGFYINMIAMRNKIDPAKSFTEFYNEIKASSLNAFSHQDFPFDQLVEDLNLKRDMSRSPIFDIILVLQNARENISESNLKKGDIGKIHNKGKYASKYDLEVYFTQLDNHLKLNINYNTDLYQKNTIEDLIRHFNQLTEEVFNTPEKEIKKINYLTDQDKNLLLEVFNNTGRDYSHSKTVLNLFEEQVEKTPDKIAVVFKEKRLTYKELNEKADQLGNYLKENYDIQPNNLIGIKLSRSEWLIISIIAIWKSGGAYVPLDPTYPADRIQFMEEDSNCVLVINKEELSRFRVTQKKYSKNIQANLSPDDLAYVLYTSGSTGKPKGVMIQHNALFNFSKSMSERLELDTEDSLLALTSMSFDISILELIWTVCNGIEVSIKPDGTSLDLLSDYKDNDIQMDFSLFYFASQSRDNDDKYEFLIDSIKFADQNNFKAIWLPERHFHEFGGIFPNPSLIAASVATITDKIELRSGSVVLPLHDSIRVAEEWSVVDNLSKGRVALSVASGWHVNDFVLKSNNYKDRHSIMYQQVEELKLLWKGGEVKRINGLGKEVSLKVFPKPIQKELPIWVTSGGNQETFKSAGKIGANILTHLLGQNIEKLEGNIKAYKASLKSHGHSVENAKITVMIHTYIGSNTEEVRKVVEEPFKNYLRSSISLLKNLMNGIDMQSEEINDDELDGILEVVFDRYWTTAALFGTKESCSKMIRTLHNIGITEVGCLIDFGIEKSEVIKGLTYLNGLNKKFNNTNKVDVNEDRAVTSIQITPSYLKLLMDDKNTQGFLKSLKHIIVGGESFPIKLKKQLLEITNAAVYNMYGPTEATIWATMDKVTSYNKNIIGTPLPNVTAYVLNKEMSLCPIGAIGELYIGGRCLSKGYLNRDSETSKNFVTSPFNSNEKIYKTGDLVRWTKNQKLEFIGRADNQVKIRGHRIELGEIEYLLEKKEGINAVVALVKESKAGEKELIVYFIAYEDQKSSILRDYLSRKLPEYMLPSQYIQLEEFPLTSNGKINKKVLIELVDTETLDILNYTPPTNSLEEKLIEIWEKLLNKKQIGITDDFFNIGGTSIKIINMRTEINTIFKAEINVVDLFNNRTIKALAALISTATSYKIKEIEIDNQPNSLAF